MKTLTFKELCEIKQHTPRTLADLDAARKGNIFRTLGDNAPHESWGGWLGFLKSCEVRRWEYGVVYYGKTNCNYILFPNGLIVANYAFWGDNIMARIAEDGWEPVLANIVKAYSDWRDALNGILTAVGSGA